MREKVSIIKIGKIAGNCYDKFEDVWVGYNQDIDKIEIIATIETHCFDKDVFDCLESKIAVNIAREFGTKFVEDFCKVSVIGFL